MIHAHIGCESREDAQAASAREDDTHTVLRERASVASELGR